MLQQFMQEIDWPRCDDPLSLLRESNTTIYERFAYTQNITRVDSPIDEAFEAWLPGLDWVSFDPTNNLINTDRHISVSVANDYATASPSRGVFKGAAVTELTVRVQVEKLDELPVEDKPLAPEMVMPRYEFYQAQQQQQQ